MGDDERTFEISNQQAHLFNGNALELKGGYLNTLQNILGLRQYIVEPIGDGHHDFLIIKEGDRVAHMFLARNADGGPNILMIMSVPHFEEHLYDITSLVQDWFNNTPVQGGSRKKRRSTRRKKSKKSAKAQRKH